MTVQMAAGIVVQDMSTAKTSGVIEYYLHR